MPKHLFKLEQLVRQALLLETDINPDADTAINELYQAAVNEREMVGLSMLDFMTNDVSTPDITELRVRQLQYTCTTLANALVPKTEQQEGSLSIDTLLEVQQQLLACCDAYLEQIVYFFPDYFNRDMPVPMHSFEQHRLTQSTNVYQLEYTLQKLGYPHEIVTLCLEPLHLFIDNKLAPSYHVLQYVQQFAKALLQLETSYDYSEQGYNPLEKCLLEYNLNSKATQYYFMQQLSHGVLACNDTVTQVRYWQCQIGQLQQITSWHFPFYEQQPELVNRLVTYSQEELYLLLQKPTILPSNNTAPTVPSNPRLLVTIPVPQIALLVRLFVEAGIIKTNNQTALVQMIAGYVHTEKVSSISSKSLRNNLYESSISTIQAVKDMLFGLIRKMR